MEKKNNIKRNDAKTVREKLPEHLVNLVAIVKNNSEIRRFTSLSIINYLKQKNVIQGEHNFVLFNWTKFTVKSDGLGIDYRYNENFFIKSLVGAFDSFANNAGVIINTFIDTEREKYGVIKGHDDVIEDETIEEVKE